MTYLSRDERRAQIVDAAVKLTISDGLSAATVRGVAAAINASPGQIHHHFPSANALRAEAFREFGQRLAEEYELACKALVPLEQLRLLLNCKATSSGAGVERLWKEAIFASGQDVEIREAVKEVLEKWRITVADTLRAVLDEQGLSVNGDLFTASRRLIGIAIGWDLLADFDFQRADNIDDLKRYIDFELSGLTSQSISHV